MKKPLKMRGVASRLMNICIKTVLLIFLSQIPVCFSYAEFKTDCSVPQSLNTKMILFSVDEEYSLYSPEVIGLIEFHFKEKSFINNVIQSQYVFPGNYDYQVIDKDLAIISIKEVVGNLVSKYQILLVCISDIQGYFIYSLEHGERMPNVHRDTGLYILR
ncbi:hypothetical protein [Shewanella surugensis]|uniref:Uncharacterized protein n=1 Tax=Shewanella surugensis TaxID=212020 RepID=A0ABT0L5X5_9GAMM|nr:hypothetical protein [Shewanella surugensis]MCL1123091.1 hypothetical protein [Shewanella surugensis]